MLGTVALSVCLKQNVDQSESSLLAHFCHDDFIMKVFHHFLRSAGSRKKLGMGMMKQSALSSRNLSLGDMLGPEVLKVFHAKLS